MAIDYEKISSAYVTVGGKHKKVVTIYEVQNGVYVKVYNAITYITTVPSQSGSLTYTGATLTPTWSNYDSTQLTIGGTTNATNAGTYTVTFTPKRGYAWSDGSISAKSVTWTIAKASCSLSISPTSIEFNAIGDSYTIEVDRLGDGKIIATSNNANVSVVSVSDTTVIVTCVGSGYSTITIYIDEGTNHNSSARKTCAANRIIPLDEDLVNLLIDFNYSNNGNGTVTLTSWKGTYNGVASTELVIPNDSRIIL